MCVYIYVYFSCFYVSICSHMHIAYLNYLVLGPEDVCRHNEEGCNAEENVPAKPEV